MADSLNNFPDVHCGCGKCHQELWCCIPVCNRNIAPNSLYCYLHACDPEAREIDAQLQPKEHTKGFCELRAEELVRKYPGKESFTRLVAEMKSHKRGFKPGTFGRAAADVL